MWNILWNNYRFVCEIIPEIVHTEMIPEIFSKMNSVISEIVSEMFPGIEIILESIPEQWAMTFLQFLHYQQFIVWMFQKFINALSERVLPFVFWLSPRDESKAMKSSPLLGPFCGSEFWGFSLLKI